MRSEPLTRKLIPKASLLEDVTDWSSVPSGLTFSIDTIISWLLAPEPSFYDLPMDTWFPSVSVSLTDGF